MPTFTREQVEQEYTVENGIIKSPGKFENESVYAIEFYTAALDGCGEDLETEADSSSWSALVEIEPDDRIEFPELGENKYILVCENELGFVSTNLIENEAEANKIRGAF